MEKKQRRSRGKMENKEQTKKGKERVEGKWRRRSRGKKEKKKQRKEGEEEEVQGKRSRRRSRGEKERKKERKGKRKKKEGEKAFGYTLGSIVDLTDKAYDYCYLTW